jgi:hypothetical protein
VPFVETILARDRAWTGRVPSWAPICPGWSWPHDLASVLDRARIDGHIVALDLRPVSWVGAEQRAALVEVDTYARVHTAEIAGGRIIVWREGSPSPRE